MKVIKRWNKEKQKYNKGALTVEAAIVLPIFICAIFTIGFLIKIIYVHEVVQHAITESATELASYSYLYSKSGLKGINDSIEEGAQEDSQQVKSDIGTVTKAYKAFGDFAAKIPKSKEEIEDVSLHETEEGFQNLMGNLQDVKDRVKEIGEDPSGTTKTYIGAGIGEGYKVLKVHMLKLIRFNMVKYLRTDDIDSGNVRLENLGVVGGINGLDFSKSSLFSASDGSEGSAGKEDIDIIVRYKFDFKLPIPIIKNVNIIQRATVRGWMNGDE